MFDVGLTKKDLIRAGWAALFAFAGAFSGVTTLTKFSDLKAAAIAGFALAIAAAASVVKNGLLADGSTLKG